MWPGFNFWVPASLSNLIVHIIHKGLRTGTRVERQSFPEGPSPQTLLGAFPWGLEPPGDLALSQPALIMLFWKGQFPQKEGSARGVTNPEVHKTAYERPG